MTKTKKTFNLFAISEARNVLFGIATLWIGLFHSDFLNDALAVYIGNWHVRRVFTFFRGMGNIGVDIFLLLSGIGLFFSFVKDSNVLSFWKKRLMRVLPTAILIATFYFSLRYVHGKYEEGLLAYISRMTFTYFYVAGERVFWFISLILLLYLLFPLFYKAIEKWRLWGMLGLIAVVLIFTFTLRAVVPAYYVMVEIALCRIPVFIIGIWAGKFVLEKKEIDRRWLWAFLAVAVAATAFIFYFTRIMKLMIPGYNKGMETMYIFFYRYAACPLAISLTVLISFICTSLRHAGKANLLRNFFEFVGMYSMEYYMIYLNINHYLEGRYKLEPMQEIMLYFGSFIVSLVLCVMVRKVCDYFMAYMQRKPKDYHKLKAKK